MKQRKAADVDLKDCIIFAKCHALGAVHGQIELVQVLAQQKSGVN